MPHIFSAPNTHQVFDWLWSSGQPSEVDLRAIADLGIGTVVNLALPTASNALPGEAEMVANLGMNYFHIPVEWQAPTPENLADFFRLMDAFRGMPLWVHCALNMRVSVFVYLYRRMRLNEVDAAARRVMDRVWTPDAVWSAFIAAALAGVSRGNGP